MENMARKFLMIIFVACTVIFIIGDSSSVNLNKTNPQDDGISEFETRTPVPDLVMIVEIKLVENKGAIKKVTITEGRYIKPRPMEEANEDSFLSEKSKLIILDNNGRIVFQKKFNYPRIMTIPPDPPGEYAPEIPPVIYLDEPEVSIVAPYFEEATIIKIINADKSITSQHLNDTNALYEFSEYITSKTPGVPAKENEELNILIMASNYNSSTMSFFISRAEEIKNYLLMKAPFSYYSININIYQNTNDLGCYTGCRGISRLLCCDTSKVIAAAVTSGYLYDEIIVIHNTPTYSGSGYREGFTSYKDNSYNSYCTVYGGMSPDTTPQDVCLHEFGHSFGNLCDEYTYTTEGYTYSPCVNCRASCDDWSSITFTCQQGCDAKNQYYRPENSIMLSLSYPYFNAVSIKAPYFPDGLEKRLNFFTGKEQIYAPLNFTGKKVLNRSLLLAEYINILNWTANPSNINISKYRIYQVGGDEWKLLTEVDSNTFEYWQRKVEKDKKYFFALVAVNDEGREGEPAFTITQ